jgi:starch synthase
MASGGFKDVVREFNPTTLQGTGFVFHEYTEEAFLDAIGRGIFFYKNKRLWERLIMNGMKADFSIKNTSKRYLELYKMAAEKHLKKCLSF